MPNPVGTASVAFEHSALPSRALWQEASTAPWLGKCAASCKSACTSHSKQAAQLQAAAFSTALQQRHMTGADLECYHTDANMFHCIACQNSSACAQVFGRMSTLVTKGLVTTQLSHFQFILQLFTLVKVTTKASIVSSPTTLTAASAQMTGLTTGNISRGMLFTQQPPSRTKRLLMHPSQQEPQKA